MTCPLCGAETDGVPLADTDKMPFEFLGFTCLAEDCGYGEFFRFTYQKGPDGSRSVETQWTLQTTLFIFPWDH